MKKIFTLFAVALLSVAAYAQDEQPCPTKMEVTPAAESQPADAVELEFGFVYNNSLNLNGFNTEFTKPAGATWKRAQGVNYVTAKGYAPFILERLEELMGEEPGTFTDEDKEGMLGDLLDNKSSVKNDNLVFIQVLSTNDCRFYPNHAGKVGKGKIDMSALEDGEYEIKAEATPETASFSYTGGPEGKRAWTSDEPIVLILKKEGDQVTTGINIIEAVKNIANVTYYNLQGVESATPFDGISIKVTTYEDGTKSAVKVLK